MVVGRIALPSDVRWVVRCFCFDPPHPGCTELLLGSRTFNSTVRVVCISTGYRHVAFVSADGRLFTHGNNSLGQCGLRADLYPATTAPSVSMVGAERVSCGRDFTVATTFARKVWFCGAYNYHPTTRSFDACVGMVDQWVAFYHVLPGDTMDQVTHVVARGGCVRIRWQGFDLRIPVRNTDRAAKVLRGGIVWGDARFSGITCGPNPRWRVQSLRPTAPLCSACGRSLSGKAIVVCPCCIMHLGCAGICFAKSARCPCGNVLGPLLRPGGA